MKVGSARVVSCCVYDRPKNVQYMHSNIPYMFDCWVDPVVQLLLPKRKTALRPGESIADLPKGLPHIYLGFDPQ